MNKYIYKVRFVTLNFFIQQEKELILANNSFKNRKKLIANKSFEKYEYFMSILMKIS